jgi:hypothetical protein
MSDKKPVIFISYSHKDEPERDPDGEIHWLGDILSYVAPAVNGTYELWTDEDIAGGADWESKIKEKLAACDICILLVSRHSLASKYVIEVEIDTILKRRQQGHAVQLYPIVLSPFPQAAAPASLLALNLRPRLDKPLSGFSRHDRGAAISKITDEIVDILRSKTGITPTAKTEPPQPQAFVHTAGLPETAYERLVGREAALERLDEAWNNHQTNIISLIAEGGAGKSALVNEWLKKLQANNYCGAETVLGWSFYSQGTKERATSAEQFLNWAVDKLGIKIETTSATAKGEAISEALARRRVLLLLDGCEPLQHGLDKQQGELKDQGLRALLRRFAAIPPNEAHGLVVLTSRLAVRDVARWKETSAPVVDVEKLSEKAGAALLRDNGVWGTDKELHATARDFGGHPLALGLLASFLKETHFGDVRQRVRIRGILHDEENPRHDHARRVMESYEKEWLAGEPVEHAIMSVVGLFDRPASGECLAALCQKPAIIGLTDAIVDLDQAEWRRAVARLREARLLAPSDPAAQDALDAHPLVREWFGERLRRTNETAWKEAQGRLYEYLRDETKEGELPTLEGLSPLYQAIGHGCRAGYHQEALEKIYVERICRRRPSGSLEFYSKNVLGAFGSDLAAISLFFDVPYHTPSAALKESERIWLLAEASTILRAQGQPLEALSAMRSALSACEALEAWEHAATIASNIGQLEVNAGNVTNAIAVVEIATRYIERGGDSPSRISIVMQFGEHLFAAGRSEEALLQYLKASKIDDGLVYAVADQWYRDFLLSNGNALLAIARARDSLAEKGYRVTILSEAVDYLTLGRAHANILLQAFADQTKTLNDEALAAGYELNRSVEKLRAAGQVDYVPLGLLAHAALRRSIGDWDGVARALDEVEEIAESGPMKLFLCDLMLERARLAFAKIEAFTPLNGLIGDRIQKPAAPETSEAGQLKEEARTNLVEARKLIAECGYHRRDKELAELEAVLRGERKFADLPPRV